MSLRKLRKRVAAFCGRSLVGRPPRHIPIVIDREGISAERPATYLTVAAIVKDEAPYLDEWLRFHRLAGVERFVLYDNESTDNTRAVLAPHIREGWLELIPWPRFLAGSNAQHLAYAHALCHLSGRSRWVALIDADEFLFAPSGSTLAHPLRRLEGFPAIAVFLRCFGPSGHERRPNAPVIESYTRRLPDEHWQNRQYRSIIQPQLSRSVIGASRIHNIVDNIPAYDETGRPIRTMHGRTHVSRELRINYYPTKSLEEYRAKVARRYFGAAKNDALRRDQKQNQNDELIRRAVVEDREIQQFLAGFEVTVRGPRESSAT